MDLYYNNQLISSISVLPEHTIAQLKQTIKNWLYPQGITNYKIRLIFNGNTELSPIVFDTNQYDNINFESKSDILIGGKIYITLVTNNIIEIKGNPNYRQKNSYKTDSKRYPTKTKETTRKKGNSERKRLYVS